MKAGLFDPYLDTLAGGERYMATVAECLLKQGWSVDFFWNKKDNRRQLEERFRIDLTNANFVPDVFSVKTSRLAKRELTKNYDLIFYLSDGSIPFLFSSKNILHFQAPFQNIGGRSILNRIKFLKINSVVCNSQFTKKFIDKEFGVNSQVIYPPVSVDHFKPGKKENIILSVGRFSQTFRENAKKQEMLIGAFKNLLAHKIGNWRLVFAGGLRNEDKKYFQHLIEISKSLPIEFLPNLEFIKLQKIYSQAKLYWHATGYKEDESIYPERMEHFGITIVEAMAAGCVPVVISKGGIPEIVDHGINGFLWEKECDFKKMTLQLIESRSLQQKMSEAAIKKAQNFSKDIFYEKIIQLATSNN